MQSSQTWCLVSTFRLRDVRFEFEALTLDNLDILQALESLESIALSRLSVHQSKTSQWLFYFTKTSRIVETLLEFLSCFQTSNRLQCP
jgi:hypothetical protein